MLENAFIDWLRRRFATADPSVLTGSGPDDCAHVAVDAPRLAFSIDSFAEGCHFAPDTPPRLIAAKAMGASLSDLAASGCRARWALASVCFRRGLGGEWARDFADSLAETAERYGAAIIGGDTTSSAGGVFVTVCVAGEPMSGGPVTRAGARPGDALVVTGQLGGSLLGKHLRPEPRFAEMRALLDFQARRPGGGRMVGAAMDISDGLALDLSRLAAESRVGAVIETDLVPVSDAARRMAGKSGRPPLGHAFSDGEDFELLLAIDAGAWSEFNSRGGAEAGLTEFTRIGWFTDGEGLSVQDASGRRQALQTEGYIHEW